MGLVNPNPDLCTVLLAWSWTSLVTMDLPSNHWIASDSGNSLQTWSWLSLTLNPPHQPRRGLKSATSHLPHLPSSLTGDTGTGSGWAGSVPASWDTRFIQYIFNVGGPQDPSAPTSTVLGEGRESVVYQGMEPSASSLPKVKAKQPSSIVLNLSFWTWVSVPKWWRHMNQLHAYMPLLLLMIAPRWSKLEN